MKHVFGLTTLAALALALPAFAAGSGDHHHDDADVDEMIEHMTDMHEAHDHGHDLAAMTGVSRDDMHRTIDYLMDVGLAVPPMNSERGRVAFFEKGCVVCHQVNGVGGEVGPSFDAADMPEPMNAFEFAARMWRGAPAMAQMQEDLFGGMIDLTGQELADIVAFVHDGKKQATVTAEAIPDRFRPLIPE